MRLFIGLPLSRGAAEDTARLADLAASVIPGRYALKSNYHMTLAFLGETPPERLEDVKLAVRMFAARFPAPQLTLGALSYFKPPQSAILVREVRSAADLLAMHSELTGILDAFSLPHTPGPFTPHVTLARHADLRAAAPGSLPAQEISYTPEAAVLFLSARDEANVLRYTPLSFAPFGGEEPR